MNLEMYRPTLHDHDECGADAKAEFGRRTDTKVVSPSVQFLLVASKKKEFLKIYAEKNLNCNNI
jgi:hypothetical protein